MCLNENFRILKARNFGIHLDFEIFGEELRPNTRNKSDVADQTTEPRPKE